MQLLYLVLWTVAVPILICAEAGLMVALGFGSPNIGAEESLFHWWATLYLVCQAAVCLTWVIVAATTVISQLFCRR